MTTKNDAIGKIEGGRAAFAFDEVAKSVENSAVDSKKYCSYVKKMPSLIQVNGLGQTLAFYFSKIEKDGEGMIYGEVYRTVAKWLQRQFPEHFRESTEEDHHLIKVIINLESGVYRVMTMETLALLNWMRKFADGLVSSDEA